MEDFINKVFDLCVDLLLWVGDKLGMSYEAINVWIFVVIEPVIFIVLVLYIIHLRNKINTLAK